MNDKTDTSTKICRQICSVTDEMRDVWLRQQPFAQARKIMGMTISQQRLLRTIWRKMLTSPQGVMLKELADALKLSCSAVSVMVDNMVRRGYLERTPAEDDRRKVFIRISGDGMRQTRKYEQSFGELSKPFFDTLSEDKAGEFLQILEQFQQFLIKETEK